ncbi:MAG: DinB family protein [Chitinophagaceae bacterium]|nr:DinB family protein [Chitinophagaceae bacterium]
MNTIPEMLTEALKSEYEGPNWICIALKDTLTTVESEKAFWKPYGNVHSIAEIVCHIIAWRQALIKVLKGIDKWELDQEASFDVIPYGKEDEIGWSNIKAILEKTQHELLELISGTTSFEKTVPARNYNYIFFISGIIYHDTYHLGQIVLLIKQYPAHTK